MGASAKNTRGVTTGKERGVTTAPSGRDDKGAGKPDSTSYGKGCLHPRHRSQREECWKRLNLLRNLLGGEQKRLPGNKKRDQSREGEKDASSETRKEKLALTGLRKGTGTALEPRRPVVRSGKKKVAAAQKRRKKENKVHRGRGGNVRGRAYLWSQGCAKP